jgi:hypothetical protein
MVKGFDKYPAWAYALHRGSADEGYEFTRFIGRAPEGEDKIPGYYYDMVIKIRPASWQVDKRFMIYKKQDGVYYGPAVEEGWTPISRMKIATKRNIFNRIFA